jgi:DNA-directed RNA polymerase specialized sigma subunit
VKCPNWEASEKASKYKDDPERLRAEEIATVFALNYKEETEEARTLAMGAYDDMLLVFEGYIRAKARELSSSFADAFHVKKDLTAIGQATLLDNMRRWHPSQGRRFSRGNVDRNIKSAMYKYLNHEERIVDLPSQVLKDMFRYNAAKASGEAEKVTEVIQGWTQNHLEAVRQYAPHAHPHNNRNYIISESEDENVNHLTYHATFEGSPSLRGAAYNPYRAISAAPSQSDDVREILEEELRNLPRDEELAIRSKFLLGQEQQNDGEGATTLREIGRRQHVTGESIRQRIACGLRKLRPRLAKRGINTLDDVLA